MPGLAQHVVHLGAHAGAQAGVEGRERLVEEDDLGIGGQRPGQRHPLLLTARELMGVAPSQPGQPDHASSSMTLLAALRPAAQSEGDVAADREVREERALLGHVADAAVLARHEDVTPVVDHLGPELHLTAVEALEAGDDPQQRRLAAARDTEDAREAAGRDGQVDTVEHCVVAERLAGAADDELLHRPIVTAGSTSAVAMTAGRPDPGRGRAGREPVEPAAEHVAGHRRDEHHDPGVGRGRASSSGWSAGPRTPWPGSARRSG